MLNMDFLEDIIFEILYFNDSKKTITVLEF